MTYFRVVGLAGILALAVIHLPVSAATLTVSNTNDSGAGSLRGAIASAAAGDTIVFGAGVSGTIPLLTSLTVTQNLVIEGQGEGMLTLSGQNTVRVIDLTGGALTLSRITIANGATAGFGGGINVASGASLTLGNSVLSGNSAGNGGALAVADGGSLTVTGTTFQNNITTSVGGGGLIVMGTATLIGNTFVGNTAPINGGAINVQGNGILTAINNTFSANASGSLGGAMSSLGAASVINNTFSANQGSAGSAIATANTSVTLYNNVFADNVASVGPGALSGAFTTSGFNVFYNNTVASVADDATGYSTSDFTTTATSPLAALGSYGGPTQTMMPLAESALICKASIGRIPGSVTTDQRGQPRITRGCLDVGSVQYSVVAMQIPTLSTWAFVLLGGLLATFGMRGQGVRRR